MLGLFFASLGLAMAVAAISLATPDSQVPGCANRAVHTLRFWTLYLACFGAIGAAMSALALPGPLLVAVTAGTGAGLAHLLWSWFGDASADVGLGQLVGQEGRVLLPVGSVPGKIVVETRAERIELVARSDDGGRIERGRRVLVAFVEDGVAAVISLDPRR